MTQLIMLSSTGKPSVVLNLPQFHLTLTVRPSTLRVSVSASSPKYSKDIRFSLPLEALAQEQLKSLFQNQ
jgi:hypothetical protein